jgi:hypothetical protein
MKNITLPTGQFKGRPLNEPTTNYLQWYLATVKTSSGVGAGIAAELERRGVEVPPAPAAREPRCPAHPDAGFTVRWQDDSLGRPHIRAACGRCRRFLKFVPCVQPFTSMANATAGSTTR